MFGFENAVINGVAIVMVIRKPGALEDDGGGVLGRTCGGSNCICVCVCTKLHDLHAFPLRG